MHRGNLIAEPCYLGCDQSIGDGDYGLNTKRRAQAIQATLAEMGTSNLNVALQAIGRVCVAVIEGS